MGPPVDIYSFGMCALEMAALEIIGNGDSGNKVTEENVKKTIDSLEDQHQKDFILKCLSPKPEDRPTSKELLFHPLLFEVHSLKLLAAHCLVRKSGKSSSFSLNLLDLYRKTQKIDYFRLIGEVKVYMEVSIFERLENWNCSYQSEVNNDVLGFWIFTFYGGIRW